MTTRKTAKKDPTLNVATPLEAVQAFLSMSSVCDTVALRVPKATQKSNTWVYASGCQESSHTALTAAHPRTSKAVVLAGNGDWFHVTTCGECGAYKVAPMDRYSVYVAPGFIPDGVVSDIPESQHHGWFNRHEDGTFARRTSRRPANDAATREALREDAILRSAELDAMADMANDEG